jgi:DNA-binding CsgD family transcriptional regulator
MPSKPYPYSSIYNDIEKVQQFWNKFKPENNSSILYQGKWKLLAPFFEQLSAQKSALILLSDISTSNFIYAVDERKVVGHDVSLYMADNGLDFSISNIHPDFLNAGLLMNNKAMEYMMGHQNKQNKIIVSLDGKYKKKNGDYMHFLQQIVCVEIDENGNPLLFLSYIYDISYLKKEKTANLIIHDPDETEMWNYNFEKGILEAVSSLSIQEKRVLVFLGKGKLSKEIAKELFISSHTVDTHRRNLLKKTNCLDTSGLITYSKLVGLL